METDATAADHEMNNQKKMKKSNSVEVELAIDSEKSKVIFLIFFYLKFIQFANCVLPSSLTVSLSFCPSVPLILCPLSLCC
jgi:hypothetical protein